MSEMNALHRRMETVEAELASVLGEIDAFRRTQARKRRARWLMCVAVVMAVAAYRSATAAAARPGTTVAAPFDVVDDNNEPIFAVKADPRGLMLYPTNSGLVPRIVAIVDDKEQYFKIGPGNVNVWLGVRNNVPSLKFRSGGGDRERLSFTVAAGGTPIAVMYGDNGQDIMQMRGGPHGEGLLQLMNAQGEVKVKAGLSDAGYGRVEALPLGNPMGSFIVGRPR